MSLNPIRALKKITAALLFGALLSFGCASIAMTEEKDQPTLPDIDNQVAALKDSFTGLYRNLWNKHNLSVRLRDCVTRAVDDYSGFFTAFANQQDYIKAQTEIINLMSSEFNALLGELQEQFNGIFAVHVVTYYRDLFQNLLENADDPAIQAKLEETGLLRGSSPGLRDEAERASSENRVKPRDVYNMANTGNDVIKKITGIDPASNIKKMGVSALENLPGADTVTDFAKAGISAFKKLTGYDLELGAGLVANPVTSIAKIGVNAVEGLTGVGVTNFMANVATQMLGSWGALSLFQSAAALVSPAWMIYDVYKAAETAVNLRNGAQNMRNSLYDQLYSYYRHRKPEELWKQMDKPVRETLQGFYAQIIRESVDAIDRQDSAAALSLYEEPTGIPQQSEEYKKGLALYDEKKYNEARTFYEAGAEKGDPWCINALGEYYNEGKGGLQKNDARAVELINKAADLNLPLANYWLGKCYMEGSYGLSANSQKGLELIYKAAKLNDPEANYCLGNYYSNGTHVAQNFQTARDYYKKAKELGDKRASKGLYGLEHLPDLFVTPEQLVQDYYIYVEDADMKYKGKAVRLSGVISNVDYKSDSFSVLTFDVPEKSSSVYCFFGQNNAPDTRELEKGDKVTIQGGEIKWLAKWNVEVNYCWVVCTD